MAQWKKQSVYASDRQMVRSLKETKRALAVAATSDNEYSDLGKEIAARLIERQFSDVYQSPSGRFEYAAVGYQYDPVRKGNMRRAYRIRVRPR